MSNRHLVPVSLAIVLLGSIADRAPAQTEVPTGGLIAGFQEVLDEIPLPDGRTIRRLRMRVAVTADDPSSPWHLGSQDCFATYTFAADGALEGGRGVCDFVSPEGDLWWLTLEASGSEPIRWQGLGEGTGKLAGLEHRGTTVPLAEWSDGRIVGRWEGTMTKK
ncbi:MAG TPA: hypothetical protein VLA66_06855 [Thermoanaerobaculia bacterium]|nr:hypothetical protein [Thermoanaerobaculia bacterium]